MTVDQMRGEIASVYPGLKWHNRVAGMLDNQVIAIYKTFQANGKLESDYIPVRKNKPEDNSYHQMTIFEYMKGEMS